MANETRRAPQEGDKAPDFKLVSGEGETVKLGGLRGQPVVVYFYPKDDTPGCTVEAKEFQQHLGEFETAGTVVLGISPDDGPSHCRFAGKYGLTFRLLSDTDHKAAESYGAWVEKSMYGKKYWGVQRSTYLVGPDGKIARAWLKVKPQGHAEEVLEAVRALVG